MSAHAALSRPGRGRGLVPAVLVVLVAALAVAFVFVPWIAAGAGPGGGYDSEGDLRDALRESFVAYWRSGDRDVSPGLERVVDYWFRFHLVKGLISALMLGVLIALGVIVWKAFVRADALGAGRRAALASAGVVVSLGAVFSLVALMANVQGLIAPLSSLMPMVVSGKADPTLTSTLDQIRGQLEASPGAGGHSPALDLLIDDFARYHAAMAVIAATVMAAFIALSVALWRKFARTDRSGRRARRVLASFGAVTVLLSLALVVVTVANTYTAGHSAPALQAFFEGSW
ncbi:hypothetical protein [Actinomadura chibensis]|uniref:Tat (Twin-arginine translocation) pathway signal sequence n=1 Tax=Actinomadura chibensis TaxID=392828 RepID=A0A5D0NLJ4_9ACTN|nr:hypothetical protein [Actinomadura chibensis]TYB45312.1 hypothetical protein FXF69_17830 [Actinomadura chibensis]